MQEIAHRSEGIKGGRNPRGRVAIFFSQEPLSCCLLLNISVQAHVCLSWLLAVQ